MTSLLQNFLVARKIKTVFVFYAGYSRMTKPKKDLIMEGFVSLILLAAYITFQ